MDERQIVEAVLRELKKQQKKKPSLAVLGQVQETVLSELQNVFEVVDIKQNSTEPDYLLLPVLKEGKNQECEATYRKEPSVASTSKAVHDLSEQRLLLEKHLCEIHAKSGAKVRIRKDCIVTPLAKDYIMEHHIELIPVWEKAGMKGWSLER